eukprot:2318108-Rhodomonas_salina.1
MDGAGVVSLSYTIAQAQASSLTSLDLSGNRALSECAEALARIARNCTNLAQLNLSCCGLTEDE